MRFGLCLGALVLAGVATAQVPDFRVRLDLSLALQTDRHSIETGRLFTPLGRPSTATLTLFLETGFDVVLSQRLQRLPGNADDDIFDESYIEDPGIWRIGKQYVPFGTGRILRESVIAARADTNLIAERAPISAALVGGQDGRQSGVVARIGRSFGASLALGDHFGIAPTALNLVRRPEDSLSRGQGWDRVFGADVTRRAGKLTWSGEFATFSGSDTERDLALADFELTYISDGYRTIGVGWTTSGGAYDGDFLRIFGRVYARRNVDIEPLLRFRDGAFYDASITVRVRL